MTTPSIDPKRFIRMTPEERAAMIERVRETIANKTTPAKR